MSVRLSILNLLLRLATKPALGRMQEPTQLAAHFERFAKRGLRIPPKTLLLPRPGGLSWISKGRCASRKVVLYFHGGGYVAGSAKTHLSLAARISHLARVEVCLPEYRLAQEARFPAAFDDSLAAFHRLLDIGYRPQDIILGGDSAGGGLCLAVLSRLLQDGIRPAAAFALSPWTDLAATGASLEDNRQADPMLPSQHIDRLIGMYLDEADRRDPRASPLYGAFPAPPPVFLTVGESEVLRDDCLRMAEVLRSVGGEVTVSTWPDVPHVWQIFDGWIPEARASLREIAGFIQDSWSDKSR